MIKTPCLCIFMLMLFLSRVTAQPAQVKRFSSGGEGNQLSFPLISHPDSPVSRKINDYLQSNILQLTAIKAPGKKIFDSVRYRPDKSGLDELDYKVLVNSEKILSLEFDGDFMGAYPNPYESYFSFNARNGEPILVEDLFHTDGLKQLEKDLRRKRTALIAAHLAELKKDKQDPDDLDRVRQQLTDCNQDAEAGDFSITPTTLAFHKNSCLPHVMMELDANLDLSYSFQQCLPWLSDFGKKLLLSMDKDLKDSVFPSIKKPMRGTINNRYSIVMQLHPVLDGEFEGFYYYSNQGICIQLSGARKGDLVELKEQDAGLEDKAVFKGVIKGNSISGTWTDLKTKKELPFAVKN